MKIQKGTKEEWLEIINANKKLSFFSSPEWFDVVSNYSKTPYEIRKVESKGRTYLLPLFVVKRKIFSIYRNSVFGTYCGLIGSSTLKCEEESNIIRGALGNKNYNYTGCPYTTLDCPEASSEFTQVIRLSSFHVDQISKNHSRSIAKAKNKQLSILSSESLSEWRIYYKIYEEVTKERGSNASNRYEWDLFQLIYKLPPSKRKLWLIKEEEEIIGGGLFFYQNQVIYWHGCNNKRSKQVGGSHLLHKTVIQNSKELGYAIYDFNPSGGHKGVELFKSGFGTEKLFFNCIEHESNIYKACTSIYRKIKLL